MTMIEVKCTQQESELEQMEYVRYLADTYCQGSISEAVKFLAQHALVGNKGLNKHAIY